MSNTRSDQSRANGSRSRGPVTPAGKARSSRNAVKHGLTSQQIVLNTENQQEFDALRASYFEQFRPATLAEAELAEALANLRWRLRRLASIEAAFIENELLTDGKYMVDCIQNAGPRHQTAWAFARIGHRLNLANRLEASLTRAYDRTLKNLQTLQSQRPPDACPDNDPDNAPDNDPENAPDLQNEPEPAPLPQNHTPAEAPPSPQLDPPTEAPLALPTSPAASTRSRLHVLPSDGISALLNHGDSEAGSHLKS